MNGLFSNEKLGMLVEEMRLKEIRQEIESRRFARKPSRAWQFAKRLISALGSTLVALRTQTHSEQDISIHESIVE
jgi:hypothetical protein